MRLDGFQRRSGRSGENGNLIPLPEFEPRLAQHEAYWTHRLRCAVSSLTTLQETIVLLHILQKMRVLGHKVLRAIPGPERMKQRRLFVYLY